MSPVMSKGGHTVNPETGILPNGCKHFLILLPKLAEMIPNLKSILQGKNQHVISIKWLGFESLRHISTRKQTWNLKITPFKRKFICQTSIWSFQPFFLGGAPHPISHPNGSNGLFQPAKNHHRTKAVLKRFSDRTDRLGPQWCHGPWTVKIQGFSA